MSSPDAEKLDRSGARFLPNSDELQEALKVEVYDRVGEKRPLGDIIERKRSVLIFTRHFCMLEALNPLYKLGFIADVFPGCLNCQTYVRIISEKLPPSSLPANTQSLLF